jgi:hypothetical protein
MLRCRRQHIKPLAMTGAEGARLYIHEEKPMAAPILVAGKQGGWSPKRYKVCHNSDKTCHFKDRKVTKKAPSTGSKPSKKPFIYRWIWSPARSRLAGSLYMNKCDRDKMIFECHLNHLTQVMDAELLMTCFWRKQAKAKGRFSCQYLPLTAKWRVPT